MNMEMCRSVFSTAAETLEIFHFIYNMSLAEKCLFSKDHLHVHNGKMWVLFLMILTCKRMAGSEEVIPS